MGIGSLRRYHKPLTNGAAVEAAPEVEPGTTQTPEEVEAARLANEAKLAEEQQAQADAANEHPNTIAADENAGGAPAESVNPIVQEAGGVEAVNPDDPFPATIPVHPEGVEGENGAEAEDVEVSIPVVAGTPEGAEAQQEALEQHEENTDHGSVKRPTAQGSTAAWVAYAEADPVAHGLDLTPRTGLRDVIADHYLGA